MIGRYSIDHGIWQIPAFSEGHFNEDVKFVLDAGWLNPKTNWHGGKSLGIAAKIGQSVGQNHQVGKLIQEFFDANKIPYELTVPKKGRTKMGIREFRKLSGWAGPLTLDSVSAALLVWGRK